MMMAKLHEKPPAHKDSYDALIKSLFMDEDDIDKAVAAMGQSAQFKRNHNDQDKDPIVGSDQGKAKKRHSTIKEIELDKEHVHDTSLDAEENIIDETSNTNEHPDGEATPKNDWFKQPPRFNDLVFAQKDPLTFDELMATPIDFFNIELKYKKEECYKALIERLDWENPKEYFFNNDLEYLKSIDSERKYTMSITKIKVLAQQILKPDVYSQSEDSECEGDFVNLHLNDIEDMLLLVVQCKLFYLNGEVIVDLAVALHMFTRSLIIKKRVEDVQLEPYIPSFEPLRVVYEDLSSRKRLMRADELYKLSEGTLKKVRDTLHHRLLNF
ncbi:hypothetical protein Tco_0901919 [Tanacetum coccineum]